MHVICISVINVSHLSLPTIFLYFIFSLLCMYLLPVLNLVRVIVNSLGRSGFHESVSGLNHLVM